MKLNIAIAVFSSLVALALSQDIVENYPTSTTTSTTTTTKPTTTTTPTTTPTTTTTTKPTPTTTPTTTTKPTPTTTPTTTTKPTPTTTPTTTTKPTPTTTPTTTTKPTPTTTPTTTVKPTTPSSNKEKCKNCTHTQFLEDDDCTKYWVCANGEATLMNCSCGLHFNPAIGVCDWPKSFVHDKCTKWTLETQKCIEPSSTTEHTTLEPKNPPPCDKNCPYFMTVRDQISCLIFWICEQGRAYKMQCPNGTTFNSEAGVCDSKGCEPPRAWTPEDVACRNVSTEAPCCNETTTVNPRPKPCCAAGCLEEVIVEGEECKSYWSCYNGVAREIFCPQGLLYNKETNECDFEENVYCAGRGWSDDEEIPCPTEESSPPPTPA